MNATLLASSLWDKIMYPLTWADQHPDYAVQMAIVAGVVAMAIMFTTQRKK